MNVHVPPSVAHCAHVLVSDDCVGVVIAELVAELLPAAFVAVTTTTNVFPCSSMPVVYDDAVDPVITTPFLYHAYLYEVGVFVQVPVLAKINDEVNILL